MQIFSYVQNADDTHKYNDFIVLRRDQAELA
jgi:hypothetical protein